MQIPKYTKITLINESIYTLRTSSTNLLEIETLTNGKNNNITGNSIYKFSKKVFTGSFLF